MLPRIRHFLNATLAGAHVLSVPAAVSAPAIDEIVSVPAGSVPSLHLVDACPRAVGLCVSGSLSLLFKRDRSPLITSRSLRSQTRLRGNQRSQKPFVITSLVSGIKNLFCCKGQAEVWRCVQLKQFIDLQVKIIVILSPLHMITSLSNNYNIS